MRGALGRMADSVISRGLTDPPYRAARDLVLRRPPRATLQPEGAPLVHPGETPLDAARRLVVALDDSVLPIQGPPGTGKTYTGARMALALVERGQRVGVVAQSHRVIANFLDAVADAAHEAEIPSGSSSSQAKRRIHRPTRTSNGSRRTRR